MIWFTSDQHFFHQNILKYGRSKYFSSIEEMNDILIKNYNKVIKNNDTVFFLGDLSFGTIAQTEEILSKLKGKKIWILGNHDRKNVYNNLQIKKYFEDIKDYYELKYNKQEYILCHYPFETWKGAHKGTIHLYGHVHEKNNLLRNEKNRYHVGVDTNNFFPVSIAQVTNIIKNQK
jgi:calcineurin-like phosphoesterase family protein